MPAGLGNDGPLALPRGLNRRDDAARRAAVDANVGFHELYAMCAKRPEQGEKNEARTRGERMAYVSYFIKISSGERPEIEANLPSAICWPSAVTARK